MWTAHLFREIFLEINHILSLGGWHHMLTLFQELCELKYFS